MATIKRLALTATIIILVLCAGGCKTKLDTYEKFGFSFQYPSRMGVTKEKPGLDSEANEKSGSLELMSGKPIAMLDLDWMTPPEKGKTSPANLEELLDRLASQNTIIYRSIPETESHGNHIVIEQRDVLIKGFGFVRSRGIWWCEQSNRIFVLSATRPARGIISTSPTMTAADVKLPAKEKDPTYQDYKRILRSFLCHAQ